MKCPKCNIEMEKGFIQTNGTIITWVKKKHKNLGFVTANTIQAFVFGAMHGIMFASYAGMVKAILITGFTMIVAWFMGYINEKQANESIIPSWIVHSIANIFSGICAAFSIF